MNKRELEEAEQALLKVAEKKAKEVGLDKRLEKEATSSLRDMGVTDDMMTYGAAAAKLADVMSNKELEGSMNVTDDIKLQGKINPREQALKLLYNKNF